MMEWKDTLEDLGAMGLVPESAPMPEATQPVHLDKHQLARQIQSVAAPVRRRPAAARANDAAEWQAPDCPVKNPLQHAVDECDSLDALCSLICQCEACPLGAGRLKFVFGEGMPDAEMMFVGEGPGRDEDMQGRPFVGRAGALLDKMIAALNMTRRDVYIANVVKCRPPDNRTPKPTEAQTCLRYLKRQIELVKPAVLVGLGATPLRELIGVSDGITKVRGRWHTAKIADRKIPFIPTFHPAYVLRSYTKEVRQAVWDDLQAAQKMIDEV